MRKYIRIAINDADYSLLMTAKAEFENASKLSMTDAQFALSIIRRACQPKQENAA